MAEMLTVGGDLPVHRLGFGAMRLTGPPKWLDHATSIAIARRAVELGINFIDTADSYDFGDNEQLLAQALYPYPDDLVIATKGGQINLGEAWIPLGRPEYLRQQAELSLRRLRRDRIDLYQLHRIDPTVPLADQIGSDDCPRRWLAGRQDRRPDRRYPCPGRARVAAAPVSGHAPDPGYRFPAAPRRERCCRGGRADGGGYGRAHGECCRAAALAGQPGLLAVVVEEGPETGCTSSPSPSSPAAVAVSAPPSACAWPPMATTLSLATARTPLPPRP
jgi:hypothetical protein